MSIVLDSGALQTQHDDDDEYDQEDYAREQELQQMITDLPHDLLDDSLPSSPEPNYSDCSGNEISGPNQHWNDAEAGWDGEGLPNQQKNAYTENRYEKEYRYKPGETFSHEAGENISNGWDSHHNNDEESMYNYPKEHHDNESNGNAFHNEDHYEVPPCSNSELFHLPEDFQPYSNSQQSESFPDCKKEHLQKFMALEVTSNQPAESVQVRYNPYQSNVVSKAPVNQEPMKRDGDFDDLQREFLNAGESSANNMKFVQLQVLYKARGRQIEELNEKLEESERQIRYLNHQLAIVKDEKGGLAISFQESQSLLQNAKEIEVQLKGQMTALEKNINCLTTNEEQLRKELKVAKVAMESMQQQVLDMRRSDSIQRAREQHEAVVSMLKKKSEEQVLAFQQKLDDVSSSLQEQRELCCHLEDQVKQAEREKEESKLEKTEIINRLTRSLEESQKQCANLLQTGSIHEANQLRLQLQQIQSSKFITDGMNKALQEEINELKEQITMYESAAKLGVFINGGEQEDLSDSYIDLGIKKVNWQKSRFQRSLQNKHIGKDLSTDDNIIELKTELERCLNSNKTKRKQIISLQSDLKESQLKVEELKKLLEQSERAVRDCEVRAGVLEKQLTSESPHMHAPNEALKEEIQKLQNELQLLQQEAEKQMLHIKELAASEEKLKAANQELCNEMRVMIQEFDRDKNEAIERCERMYEQHHEDIKANLRAELSELFSSEKEQLCHGYEEQISGLQTRLKEINQEMTAVQECYISICKEKDTLEDTARDHLKKEFQIHEEKMKDQFQKDRENALQTLKTELENKHQSTLAEAKAQWQKEKEAELKVKIEAQLVLSKEIWNKDQLKITEKTMKDVENEWKDKLEKAVQEAKIKALKDLEDNAVQTDQSLITKTALDLELIDDLKLKFQNAVQEKEQAIREVRIQLEKQHHEVISKQVESAVTKARARWLQELTSSFEYKANLKLEREKWEKINEQKISDAVAAAEENWKKSTGQIECNIKQKDLEENIVSMKREIELKNEEYQALLKAELAKARAQWNKEKQEEIHNIQAQNESDYCAFLNEHRTKISEILCTANVDFEKQKNELITQKEAEIKERLDQRLKVWATEESQRMHARENEILLEVELQLNDIHNELIDTKCVKDRSPSVATSLGVHFLEKLRACLERSIKFIVYSTLKNAKQEWNQQYEEKQMNHISNISEYPHFKEKDTKECSEHVFQQLEKSRKECQQLRNKFEKACLHLQQVVKDQKLKAEKFKENESIAEKLRKENSDLNKKLEEMELTRNVASSKPEEGYQNGCALCRGSALEEMRTQYIKAVDKIKNDMLRYIHESKGRAAEMLKSEVMRERQETARKMRKYYLTCLQQLLKDDGKNEGAEKKIMNAASKLVTMAKVLETPISQKTHSKNSRTALLLSKDVLPETKQGKSDSVKTFPSWENVNPNDQNLDQKTIDEFTKRLEPVNLTDKMETSKSTKPEVVTMLNKNSDPSSKKSKIVPDLRNVHIEVNPSVKSQLMNRTSSEKMQSQSFDLNAESVLLGQDDPSFLYEIKGRNCQGQLKNASDRQRFDLQETPVRDESGGNDWSSASLKALFPQDAQGSLTSLNLQSQIVNAPENFAAAGLCSLIEGNRDTFGRRCEGQSYSAQIAKRKDLNHGTQHSNKMGLPAAAAEIYPDSKSYSDVGRGRKPPSRKLLLDVASPQQDSGFDSPFPNFNSYN
ncbi:centrosomal protein of 152 kDa [Discoglossus pictus]